MSFKFVSLLHRRFGRLEVIDISHKDINRQYHYACVCDCGGITIASAGNLRSGSVISCGCYKRERAAVQLTGNTYCSTHGEIKKENGKRMASPEYRTWQSMKNRCGNARTGDYKYYGGRGIFVCERWHNFKNFLEDMGRRPSNEHTLERINGNGDYSPENCVWETRKTQARNRKYAATKAWILAAELGVKDMTAHHMIWQVRQKDKGNMKWFSLSPEKEALVRAHLKTMENLCFSL